MWKAVILQSRTRCPALLYKLMGYQTKSIANIGWVEGTAAVTDVVLDEPKSENLKEFVVELCRN